MRVFLLRLIGAALWASAASSAGAATEPALPEPSPAVLQLIRAASEALERDASLLSLSMTEEALRVAAAGDELDRASALRMQARVLLTLGRTVDAKAALEVAVAKFKGRGLLPLQIDAQCALATIVQEPPVATTVLDNMAAELESEHVRPIAAAVAAHECAIALKQADLSDEALALSLATTTILQRSAPGSVALGRSLALQAVIHRERGDYQTTLKLYDRARELFARNGAWEKIAQVDQNVGAYYLALGRLPEAEYYLSSSRRYLEVHSPRSEDLAKVERNLGSLYRQQGGDDRLAKGAELARDSLAIRCGLPTTRASELAASYLLLGNIALDQADLATNRRPLEAEARDWFLDAGELMDQLDVRRRVLVLLGLANSFRRHGGALWLNQAEEMLLIAQSLQESVGENVPELAPVLLARGLLAHDRGEDVLSETLLRRAWALVKQVAGKLAFGEIRQEYDASHNRYAAALVTQLLRTSEREAESFAVLEDGRAHTLFEALARAHTGESSAETNREADAAKQELQRRGTELAVAASRRATAELEYAGIEGLSEAEVAKKVAALDEAKQGYDLANRAFGFARATFERVLAPASPTSATVAQDLPDIVGPLDVLEPGTLFLAFSVPAEGPAHVFALSTTAQTPLQVFRLNVSYDDLRKNIDRLRVEIGVTPLAQRLEPAVALDPGGRSRSLFAQLFPGNLASLVRDAERLVIAPDGPLWGLPLALLQDASGASSRYLGAEKPMTLVPSLRVYQFLHRASAVQRAVEEPAVLIGVSEFARVSSEAERAMANDTASVAPRSERDLLYLTQGAPIPLPNVRKEIEQIRRHAWLGKPLIDDAATEAAVRKRITIAGVVHLATHAYYHPTMGLMSGVVLSPPRGRAITTENDGLLLAWEITNQLRLKAEIIVLSACETALGQQIPGEGMIGLTHAFQFAGARSVVATQWSIADGSTADLLAQFHRDLRRGLRRDDALMYFIQRALKNDATKEPRHWAAFALYGASGPIRLR